MSITINFNTAAWEPKVVPCCCGGDDNMCPICDGVGTEVINDLELNLSNANWSHICASIGIDIDMEEFAGWIQPDALIKAIDSYIPGLGVQGTRVDQNANGGKVIFLGVDEEYMQMRLSKLRDIAVACKEKKISVVWA